MKTKTKLFILLVMFIPIITLGQQTISELTANAVEATDNIKYIYDLDIFRYFELTELYNTDLKRSVFKKTQDYQTYLIQLKNERVEMLKTTYYVIQTDVFNNLNYNVKRKGFELELGSNWGIGTASARTPKSIYIQNILPIVLKGLQTKQVAAPNLGKGVMIEKLFLQMSEENGLEIENSKRNEEDYVNDKSKGDIILYYFFKPNGKEKSVLNFII